MSTELLQPDAAVDWDEVRRAWQRLVRSLADDVRAWAEERQWRVSEKRLNLTEERLGSYDVPSLVIQVPQQPIFLEPVARVVMGAQGRVDLYSYPSMDRVMLLHNGSQWIIRPELGPTWPLPWSRDTFVDLVERLTADA
jgi:hypothetical protein